MASSFEEMTDLVRRFAASFTRDNELLYDPYTQTIRVLDNKAALRHLANSIKSETALLAASLSKLK